MKLNLSDIGLAVIASTFGKLSVNSAKQSHALLRLTLALLIVIQPQYNILPVTAEETNQEELLDKLPGMSQPTPSTGTVQDLTTVKESEETEPLPESLPETSPAPAEITAPPALKDESASPPALKDESASPPAEVPPVQEPVPAPPAPVVAPSTKAKEPEIKKAAPLDEDQKRVSLDIKDAELHVILNVIAQQTGVNFIATERLKTLKFTAYLRDVTLDYVLRALLEANGLAYERVGDSNIYVVKERTEAKPRVITRTYVLKYIQLLDLQVGGAGGAGGAGGTGGSGGAGGGGSSAGASLGGGISAILKSVFSEFGKMELDPRTNSIIITELPEKFPLLEELIEKLDVKAPQILIEVEIVEVDANATSEMGISFGAGDGTLFSMSGASGQTAFPLAKPLKLWPSNMADESGSAKNTAAGAFTFGTVTPNVDTVIQALVGKGHGRFLARPKIVTINNKSAEIHITEQTAVGKTISSVSAGGASAITTANVAERMETGITLWVTPQVNVDDFITLAIEPNVTRPQSSRFFPEETFVDPQTRGVKTSVRVKDGHTILIGGLMSNEVTKNVRKTPFLGDIPLIGMLFTHKSYKNFDTELLVFITPRIIRDKSETELSRIIEKDTVKDTVHEREE